MINDAMESLLRAANRLCSGDRGMPLVGLELGASSRRWIAWADYSDGYRIEEIDDDADVAVAKLTERLMAFTPSSVGA